MFGRRRAQRNPDGEAEVPDIPMNWRRLLRYLGPYKGRMAIAIAALISSAGLSLSHQSKMLVLDKGLKPLVGTRFLLADFRTLA